MMGFGAISEYAIGEAPPANRVFTASAALFGAASMLAVAVATMQGAAALSGSGALSAEPVRVRYGTAALAGTGAMAADPVRLAGGRALLIGTGSLTGQPSATINGAASLTGTAQVIVETNFRIYASTREFITRPGDQPPSTPFHGTVQKALRFDRSILAGPLGIGNVTAGWGNLELINADGGYDLLVDKYAVDGRRVVLRVGDYGRPYSEFLTLFDGTAANWHIDEDVLRVELRDNTYKLEVPLQANLYGGTGGLDGTEDLKGKRKPRAFGHLLNISPPQVIPSERVYQVNDGPVQAVPAAYDFGVALDYVGDYATSDLLRAATTGADGSGADLETGDYATCLAEGLVRLGGGLVGTFTCDVQGDNAGGFVETTADIILRMLASAPQVVIPDEISMPTFDQLNLDQPAPVGYYLDENSNTQVVDAIADLINGVGGWAGFRRSGRFDVAVFKAPSGAPLARYGKIDVSDIQRQALPDAISPQPWRIRAAWGRNWTVQTDVTGRAGITDERVAFLREGYRLARSDETDGNAIKSNHPRAQDPDPILGFFRDEAPAEALCDALLNLHGKRTNALYRMTVKSQPFVHEIGDVIELTYPRWDLKAGRLLRIVSLSEDTDENHVEIVGFG